MKSRNFTFVAIIVSAIYWLMNSAVHKFLYSENSFEIIPSDINELWMRTVIAFLLIGFGMYADHHTKAMLEKGNEKHAITEELATKNAQYQAIFENAGDGIFFYDEQCRFFRTNKHAQKVLGYTEEELNQLAVFDIARTMKPEQILSVLKSLKPGEIGEVEGVHFRKDGSSFPVDVRVVPFLLNGEKKFVSIARNVTARKQVEQQLRDSEDKYRSLFELSDDANMMFGKEGFIDCNLATLDMFGFKTKEEFLGKHPGELSPPVQADGTESRVASDERIATAYEKGKNFFEWIHRRANGEDFPAEILLTPMLLEGCEVIQAIVRDITSRKQVERALRESELRFRTLSQHAPVGIYMTNPEGECVYVNEKWQQITGLSSEEAMGSGWSSALHREDKDFVYAEWEKFARQGGEFSIECRFTWADNQDVWVSSKAIALQNSDGSLAGYLGTVTDITNIKIAEQQIIAAREEAEFANRSKSEFLARMSHELRTPLNAILGFTQLLKMKNENFSVDQNSGVEHILSGGKHLLNLIDDVLDLAKVDAGKMDISSEDIFLQDVIWSSERLVKSLAKKYEVSVNYPEEIPHHVHADRRKLEQVLVNLLSNAIKYNQKGGKVDIDIKPVDDDMIRISVKDTGCGIKPEHQKDLYEPFNRVSSSSGSVEGTGIGLTITKKLVELMRGKIGFESKFGQGSTFWVDLHAASGLFSSRDTGSQSDVGVFNPGVTSDLKVLYVEDNPANMDLMRQIFKQTMDCGLLTATNAEQGIEIAKANPPDLILMDISLPGMSGLEALKILKTDKMTSHIPVIAVSAHAMPEQVESAKNEGFADYLTKPVQVSELFDAIQDAVA